MRSLATSAQAFKPNTVLCRAFGENELQVPAGDTGPPASIPSSQATSACASATSSAVPSRSSSFSSLRGCAPAGLAIPQFFTDVPQPEPLCLTGSWPLLTLQSQAQQTAGNTIQPTVQEAAAALLPEDPFGTDGPDHLSPHMPAEAQPLPLPEPAPAPEQEWGTPPRTPPGVRNGGTLNVDTHCFNLRFNAAVNGDGCKLRTSCSPGTPRDLKMNCVCAADEPQLLANGMVPTSAYEPQEGDDVHHPLERAEADLAHAPVAARVPLCFGNPLRMMTSNFNARHGPNSHIPPAIIAQAHIYVQQVMAGDPQVRVAVATLPQLAPYASALGLWRQQHTPSRDMALVQLVWLLCLQLAYKVHDGVHWRYSASAPDLDYMMRVLLPQEARLSKEQVAKMEMRIMRLCDYRMGPHYEPACDSDSSGASAAACCCSEPQPEWLHWQPAQREATSMAGLARASAALELLRGLPREEHKGEILLLGICGYGMDPCAAHDVGSDAGDEPPQSAERHPEWADWQPQPEVVRAALLGSEGLARAAAATGAQRAPCGVEGNEQAGMSSAAPAAASAAAVQVEPAPEEQDVPCHSLEEQQMEGLPQPAAVGVAGAAHHSSCRHRRRRGGSKHRRRRECPGHPSP